ncbi:hypothetical protein LTS15_006361 [Exophiala xenobiotica]|nr:hypothetical protein LTS15_006361 [Exophiala xenobiotica]
MRRGRETRGQALRMLEIMDEALQRLYWACQAKEGLPEPFLNRPDGRITTKDILEGLGLESTGFSDAASSSNARPLPSVTGSPSVSFSDLQQLPLRETTPPFANGEETLQSLQDFDFDMPSGDFEQSQSASTVTPPQSSATPSPGMFEGQEASTYLLNSPSFQHQQNCQLHLLCRMNRLQRRAGSFHHFQTDESKKPRQASLTNQVFCEPSEIATELVGNSPGPFEFAAPGLESSMGYDLNAFPMPSLTVPR